MQDTDTDVLVVGGGPIGLALAIELGLQGRRCELVERQDRGGLAPRAKTTNVRSRELMRRWGIADALAASAPFGVDYPSDVVFATRLGGRELARFRNAFHCRPVRDERFAEHAQWIPQYRVEAVLRARAAAFPGHRLHAGVELLDWTEHPDHVQARVRELATGATASIRARFLVGADGARSTVRERLGIAMEGRSLTRHHNVVFRAPGLAARHPHGPAVMYWLVNGDVPSVVAPLDTGDRWTFGSPRLGDDDDPAAMIRAALAIDVPIEVLGRDEWTAHQLIAAGYRRGRVFLAGDACHLHPPFGGFGMNMGIGDAVDLGWKLSAVLAGWGGPALLDSYEAERREVHRRVVDEAVTNLSHGTPQLFEAGIEDEGPEGDAVRARVAATILRTKRREFDSLGIVLGCAYGASPVIAHEPGEVAPPDALDYRPSARPGARVPHAWLAPGTARGASLFDRLAPDGFTLLALHGAAQPGVAAFLAAARASGVPLSVLALDDPALRERCGAGLVLVRPDQHVAWRGDRVEAPASLLSRVAGRAPRGDADRTA